MYRNFFKRFLDLVFALILMIVLAPLFILLIILGILFFKGDPFFYQKRIGYREEVFELMKFKSMRNKKPGENSSSDESRLTPYGKFLRLTSLDELPQLLHIASGRMSFIGPRPLLIKYLPWYKMAERKRHLVRPGITGLAQVNGRNDLSWDERLSLDKKYVDEVSFFLDTKIFFKTILNILTARGVRISPRSKMLDLDTERKNMRTYLLHDRFKLRKPQQSDASQLLQIKNNKETADLLVNSKSDYTNEGILKWIDFHNIHSKNDLFVIEDLEKNKIIGHVALYNIDPLTLTCEFGILIGDSSYWGKGIGRMITTEMVDIAFHELMLQFVFLEVLKSNERAVKLYESMRFEVIDEIALDDDSGRIDTILVMQLEHDD